MYYCFVAVVVVVVVVVFEIFVIVIAVVVLLYCCCKLCKIVLKVIVGQKQSNSTSYFWTGQLYGSTYVSILGASAIVQVQFTSAAGLQQIQILYDQIGDFGSVDLTFLYSHASPNCSSGGQNVVTGSGVLMPNLPTTDLARLDLTASYDMCQKTYSLQGSATDLTLYGDVTLNDLSIDLTGVTNPQTNVTSWDLDVIGSVDLFDVAALTASYDTTNKTVTVSDLAYGTSSSLFQISASLSYTPVNCSLPGANDTYQFTGSGSLIVRISSPTTLAATVGYKKCSQSLDAIVSPKPGSKIGISDLVLTDIKSYLTGKKSVNTTTPQLRGLPDLSKITKMTGSINGSVDLDGIVATASIDIQNGAVQHLWVLVSYSDANVDLDLTAEYTSSCVSAKIAGNTVITLHNVFPQGL